MHPLLCIWSTHYEGQIYAHIIGDRHRLHSCATPFSSGTYTLVYSRSMSTSQAHQNTPIHNLVHFVASRDLCHLLEYIIVICTIVLLKWNFSMHHDTRGRCVGTRRHTNAVSGTASASAYIINPSPFFPAKQQYTIGHVISQHTVTDYWLAESERGLVNSKNKPHKTWGLLIIFIIVALSSPSYWVWLLLVLLLLHPSSQHERLSAQPSACLVSYHSSAEPETANTSSKQ